MNDALILGVIKKHDESILNFVRTYQDAVYNQCFNLLRNHHEAEEACQDVFVKAINKMVTFERRSKLTTWLYRITFTTCTDKLRRRGKHKVVNNSVEEIDAPELTTVSTIFSELAETEKRAVIIKAMGLLSEADAYILNLYYFEELTISEIEQVVCLKKSAVKTKLHRARKKLSIHLVELMPEETLKTYRDEG